MEHAGAAPRGGEEGGAVEEVALEDAEAALAGAGGEREEVVHLGLVICTHHANGTMTTPHIKQQFLSELHCCSKDWRAVVLTRVEDGGVDGVAAAEEEADEPRPDEAAGAGDQHRLPLPLPPPPLAIFL